MRFPLCAAACLLLLSACDTSDPADPAPAFSSFEASVSGDLELALSGPSWVADGYAIVDPNGLDGEIRVSHVIGLTDFDAGSVQLILDGDVQVGTFSLAPQESLFLRPRASLSVGRGLSALSADAVTGTLTLTRADEEGIAGTFRFVTERAFEGWPDLGDPTVEFRPFVVAVEGAFEADRIRYDDLPSCGDRPAPLP